MTEGSHEDHTGDCRDGPQMHMACCELQTDKIMEEHTDRQIDRQTDRQTDTLADRQTDRQTVLHSPGILLYEVIAVKVMLPRKVVSSWALTPL